MALGSTAYWLIGITGGGSSGTDLKPDPKSLLELKPELYKSKDLKPTIDIVKEED